MPLMKKTLAVCLAALMVFSLSAVGASAAEGPAIGETVLVDESDVKITLTGFEVTKSAAELTLTLENNSDKSLTFYSSKDYGNAVNGYMIDGGYLNTAVAAGKKSLETVDFSLNELSLYGITDIASIELGFCIEDENYDEYLRTAPIRLDTSLAGSVDETADTYLAAITSDSLANALNYTLDYAAQDVLYDVAGIRLVSETLIANQSGEQLMLTEFENTSDTQVTVMVSNISVNGLQLQRGSWSNDSVTAGKRLVVDTNLSYILKDGYSEAFGITDIADIAFTLRLLDTDWNDIVEPQTVQVTLQDVGSSFDESGEVVYDEDGLQIISKGLAPDSSAYSDDIHALFLVKNGSAGEVDVDCASGSVSVNGFMNDEMCLGSTVLPGTAGVLDVELYGSSLSDNDCDSIEDIEELEMTLTIRDGHYNTLAEPVIALRFGGEE